VGAGRRAHAVLAADVIAGEENEDDGGTGGGGSASGGDHLPWQQVLHVKPNAGKDVEERAREGLAPAAPLVGDHEGA
jgi:hypothetical protein